HVDLDLNPRTAGDVRIHKLQLPSGDGWSGISGQASYANKNLILRNLNLRDEEQIRLLGVDASRIDEKALGLKLDCALGGGQLSASATLTETESSLNAKISAVAQKIAAESLNKFLFLSDDYLSGEIERLVLDGAGTIDVPHSWTGSMSLQTSNLRFAKTDVDSAVLEISAENGNAILRSADIVQDKNQFHFHGTMTLPSSVQDFDRSPTTLEIAGTAPDLQRLTTGRAVQITGSAQFTGKLEIANSTIAANFAVTGESVGFLDGTIEKLRSTLRASKVITRPNPKPGLSSPATTQRPWFADLRTAMEFDFEGIHYRDQIIDSVEGSLNGSDDILGLDRLTIRRNQNELNVRGRYKLPGEVG